MPNKNLLLIHLDSVSQMMFWQFSAEMPILFELMRNAASFSHFYAASATPAAAMADLLYGDASLLDHPPSSAANTPHPANGATNLFAILRELGYATFGGNIRSGGMRGGAETFFGLWTEACGPLAQRHDREGVLGEVRGFLEETKTRGKPFALFFANANALLRETDPLGPASPDYFEQFQVGFRLLDLSVKRLLTDLTALDLLDNTMIVGVGGPGADLFRHGLSRGRIDGDTLYATRCSCPLFIHDRDVEVCISPRLVSMIDLKPTILHLLFPSRSPEAEASPFAGVNVLANERTVAFSQNMPSLWTERRCYSVTNGDFRLIVSSPDGGNDSGGLEYYLEQWDYANTRNLLDFCRLDNNGDLAGFGEPEAVHPHFFLTFTRHHIESLAQTYRLLRQGLRAFVNAKETATLKLLADTEVVRFPDILFTRKRTRNEN